MGTTGTTVGEALVEMMEPGGEFIRQVESLGQGLAGTQGVFGLPVLGRWLATKCCQAYHGGFVEPLAENPRQAVIDLVAEDGAASGARDSPAPPAGAQSPASAAA